MDLGLKGKCALVTGASKGLGQAIAEELAKEGAHLSLCARGKEDLAKTATEMRAHGVKVVAIPADVTIAADVQRVIDETIKQLGQIDILINNAGDVWVDHTVNTTDEEWRSCIEVNLYSAVPFTRGVVPHMRRQGVGASSTCSRSARIRRWDSWSTIIAPKRRSWHLPRRCHSSWPLTKSWSIVCARL